MSTTTHASSTRTNTHPLRRRDEVRYRTAVPILLLATFTLSVGHTIYAQLSGLEDPEFNVSSPLAYCFYGVAFAMTALSRKDARSAQVAVTAYLVAVLGIAIFYYPTTFTLEQQTTFGWFENDVYVGLLVTSLTLSVLRLRRAALVP
jgi:peptidoglycan/LPS O-acetylase OafA/YrhL